MAHLVAVEDAAAAVVVAVLIDVVETGDDAVDLEDHRNVFGKDDVDGAGDEPEIDVPPTSADRASSPVRSRVGEPATMA